MIKIGKGNDKVDKPLQNTLIKVSLVIFYSIQTRNEQNLQ